MNRAEWETVKDRMFDNMAAVDLIYAAGEELPDPLVLRHGNQVFRAKPEGVLWDTRWGRGLSG